MKKHLLFVILALVVSATPLLAAEGTIGVYFTENEVAYSRYAQFSSFLYEAHVGIHVEDVVRGASYMVAWDSPDVIYNSESFPPLAVYIGDAPTGVDVGLNMPIFGFGGSLVIVSTVTFVNTVFPNVPNVNFEVLPAFANESAMYADGIAVVHPLDGRPSALGDTVANSDLTWSSVKSLYR